jgi:hypothetical protein
LPTALSKCTAKASAACTREMLRCSRTLYCFVE